MIFFLDLQDRQFALHQPINLLQPLAHAQRLQQVLLLVHLDAQMPSHKIREPRGLGGFTHGCKSLIRHVFLHLGIALKLIGHRPQQGLSRRRIARHLGQILGAGFKEVLVFKIFGNPHPRLPFDQHLHSAIGQFQQLQHIGQHTGLEYTFNRRIILTGVDLARQQYLLVIRHHLFQRLYRFFAPHEKRDNHMRKDHDIAQRQDRVGGVQGF